MRTECLNHKFTYGSPINVGRLVCDVADRHQRCTQSYVRRPYGVGMLVAGYDEVRLPKGLALHAYLSLLTLTCSTCSTRRLEHTCTARAHLATTTSTRRLHWALAPSRLVPTLRSTLRRSRAVRQMSRVDCGSQPTVQQPRWPNTQATVSMFWRWFGCLFGLCRLDGQADTACIACARLLHRV